MVFGIILGSVLVVSLVSFAGIGIYSTLSRVPAPSAPAADEPTLQVPADNLPGITIQNKPETAEEILPDGKLTSEQIIEKVSPSVVAITTYVNYQNYQAEGMGSGIIIREDGYIVTNAHVIEGAKGITVQLSDGTSYEGRVVGSDTQTDLAVIKIDAAGLTAAVFGNSDQVKMGEKVLAIGNPQSMAFVGSATQGIVSGLNREVTAGGQNGTAVTHYTNLIQTDAAINPGNSGGALVDADGKLIGINTLITSYSGNYSGVGFAIPVNYAINLAQQIIAGETPTHAQLGVSLSTVSAATASRYGLPVDTGAYVAAVTPDSGAAAAGIVPGDIVTAFDGQAVESASDLMLDVRTKNPGDTVTLTVNSGGQEKEVQVTLGDDSASQKAKQEQQSQEQSMNGYSLEDLFGRQR